MSLTNWAWQDKLTKWTTWNATIKSEVTKNLNLLSRSMDFLEYLKECLKNSSIPSHRVRKYLSAIYYREKSLFYIFHPPSIRCRFVAAATRAPLVLVAPALRPRRGTCSRADAGSAVLVVRQRVGLSDRGLGCCYGRSKGVNIRK